MGTGTESQKFWAVWRYNGGGAPNRRHASKSDAVNEAARLAAQENASYYVLEVVGIVAPVRPQIDYTEIS